MVDYPPGWTCARTESRLEYYLLTTLPLPEALAVAEHVEACAPCAQRLALLSMLVVARGIESTDRSSQRNPRG
jgi:anti-sigma factor RsiW